MRLGGSLRRRRKAGRGDPWWKGLFSRSPGEKSGKKERWWKFITDPRMLGGIALLGVVGFAGGYLISTRVVYPLPPPPGDLSPVPNLLERHPSEVDDTLRKLGLGLSAVDSLNHPGILAGRIVGQSPLPGQLALVGDTVDVTISTGPEQRPVPDVLRLNADRARTILETSGFIVSVDSVDADDPRGEVVGMAPEPGSEATIPAEVHLSVSMGPPEFEMPLLLGLPEEEAVAVLDSLGLLVGEVETRFRFGRDQGLVVEQAPPARSMVQEGASVRLVVGRRGAYSDGNAAWNLPSRRP